MCVQQYKVTWIEALCGGCGGGGCGSGGCGGSGGGGSYFCVGDVSGGGGEGSGDGDGGRCADGDDGGKNKKF